MTIATLFFALSILSIVGFILAKYYQQEKTIKNLAKEVFKQEVILEKIKNSKYCHRVELRDTDENVEEIYLFTDDEYNPKIIYTHREDIPQGFVLYL